MQDLSLRKACALGFAAALGMAAAEFCVGLGFQLVFLAIRGLVAGY